MPIFLFIPLPLSHFYILILLYCPDLFIKFYCIARTQIQQHSIAVAKFQRCRRKTDKIIYGKHVGKINEDIIRGIYAHNGKRKLTESSLKKKKKGKILHLRSI